MVLLGNLIKKKYRENNYINENIEDYDNQIIDLTNIELDCLKDEESKILVEEIEKMKKEDRDIFITYYYEEKKIKEIAIQFHMSETKVKSKLFRIRKKLRKVLKKKGCDF